MPWVYTLSFDPDSVPRDSNGFPDIDQIQSDWQSIAGKQIAHDYGGVSISDRYISVVGVIVSTPREPNYADMESNFGYVTSVTEHKEIPSDPDQPMELGHGISCSFDNV
jgi:hypothetical protein